VAGTDVPTAAEWNACLTQAATRVSTRQGVVEYAERGEGPVLLSVHGSPGGYDQGLLLGEQFRLNGFRVIAPSRPGYLGTPLDTGRSCAQQADALIGLLDVLGIDRVSVLGMSGGGPSSYMLAGRHPDRVTCLFEIDSICLPLPVSHLERLAWHRPIVALMIWLLDHFPGPLLKAFIGRPASLDSEAAAEQVTFLRAVTLSGSGWPTRRVGYDNDDAQFASLGALPLRSVTCPTLIVHGTADRSVPAAHAEHAHAVIGGSELHWIANGGHGGFFADAAAQRHALSWLTEHAAN
jgi:pimeloyl-ACP methyl ester carboxylesterase